MREEVKCFLNDIQNHGCKFNLSSTFRADVTCRLVTLVET